MRRNRDSAEQDSWLRLRASTLETEWASERAATQWRPRRTAQRRRGFRLRPFALSEALNVAQ